MVTPSAPARQAPLVAVLASLALSLAAVVVFLLVRPPRVDGELNLQKALEDPEVKRSVVAQLMRNNPSMFDSHPDPYVARVMIPNLKDVSFLDQKVTTNEWGMRERPYVLPKPAGTVRVVLLGDSYVFGNGARGEDRMGVFLESELQHRSHGFQGRIEVLHIGIGSWNTLAECAFLRRQLGDLDPDLVIQVFIFNDMDDNPTVRGFGVRADFVPLFPERANSFVQVRHPEFVLGEATQNGLLDDADFESKSRIEPACAEILRLAGAIERRGGRYLLLGVVGPQLMGTMLRHLEPGLAPGQVAMTDIPQLMDPVYHVSETDAHFNRKGHERAAKLLYGLIQRDDLLPSLGLEEWPEATREAETQSDAGVAQARAQVARPERMPARFEQNRQVNGGLDPEHNASPYVSISFSPEKGRHLFLAAECYPRPEIDGGHVRVLVDETEVGSFTLSAGVRVEETFEVPAVLARRARVAVRLLADDWVYMGDDRRRCLSYVLRELEFRP